jgi:hypothetical protein
VEQIARVAEVVSEADEPVEPTEIQEATHLSQSRWSPRLRLEDAGASKCCLRARSPRARTTAGAEASSGPRKSRSSAGSSTARAST